MIRATRAGFLDLALRETSAQRASLARVQAQAVTGIALQRPSDDPVALAAAERVSAAVADQEVWGGNASAATSLLTVADDALGRVTDALVRAREIAVGMASETVGDDARAVAALELRGLAGTIRDAANTEHAGRHVFAGEAWDTAPFAADGTYTGGSEDPETRVGEDRWVRTGFDGAAIFDGAADVFGAIEALATALEADDATAVGASLTGVDAAMDAIVSARGAIGVETLAAEEAATVAESLGVTLSERLSALVEADPVETYTRLTELQSAYEATLQVVASAGTRSLLDYLG